MRFFIVFMLAAVSARASDSLVRESALKYANGDWEGARAAAAAAVAADDKSAQAHLQLAMALMKLERWAEAEQESDRALAAGYGKAAVYNVRSASRSRQGRFEQALADAEKAVALNPGGPIGYVNRAAAKAGLKRSGEEILHDYRRAAEVDSRYAGALESARRKYEGQTAARQAAIAPAPRQAAPAPAPVVKEEPGIEPAPEPAPAEEPEPAPATADRPGFDWLSLLGGGAALGSLLFVVWLLRSGWKSHRGMQVRFGSLISAPPPTVDLPPGAVVAGLYIVGRLVEKGEGRELYEARDLEDAPRALKRLSLRPEEQEQAFELARKASALRHPSLETVEAVFHEGPRVCLACVPLPGETLARLRERLPEKRWTPEQALKPFQTACEALAEAHRQGVTHGGLTPRSIVVDRGRASIRDFGLRPPVEPAEDVRALAACFAEALTGRPSEDAAAALSGGVGGVFARALESGFRSAEELFQAYRTAVVPLVQ